MCLSGRKEIVNQNVCLWKAKYAPRLPWEVIKPMLFHFRVSHLAQGGSSCGRSQTMQSKTGSLIYLPTATPAVPGGLKNLVASVVPNNTKLTCHPECYSPYQASPFQHPEESQFKCSSQCSDSGSFPKVVKLHAKNPQADAKFGCLGHKFLLLPSFVAFTGNQERENVQV